MDVTELLMVPLYHRLFGALQQQLCLCSGPALALLAASLPQLLPAGGNLRLWRQLGAVLQSQGSNLTAEQLCEALPLVQAADLPLPVEWLDMVMCRIQVCNELSVLRVCPCVGSLYVYVSCVQRQRE